MEIRSADWGYNTNFTRALEMIGNACIEKKISASEVKKLTLVVLSDMQIDAQGNESLTETMWQHIENKFHNFGIEAVGEPYEVPNILFWNLRCTKGFPTNSKQKKAIMFSGFSPALLKIFCENGIQGLEEYSLETTELQNERYNIY